MTLRLYNTLTRRKEEFRPLDPSNVRVYVCGPTVYDFAHIGNARPVVVFDVLFRLLRHLYGPEHVTYVRNITDVDDKINARAARDFRDLPLNEAIGRVTAETERQFHADVAALGCLEPTVEPRATGHIDDMKAMIEQLVDKNCAYVAEDHVLFHVAAMPDYGVLSNRSLDEMLAGARVEVAPYKRDAMDFVLWKPSSPGEPAWPSPCGIAAPGRPGWHIECSAMARKHLGDTFDIHGGGIDLVFPHHENELAQTRCALGVERMANVWMHNGFLQVEGRKMAKSEGNFVTIRELLQDWPGDVLRLQMLMTHYRQPIDWTQQQTEEADSIIRNWRESCRLSVPKDSHAEPTKELIDALADDLNTHKVIDHLHDLAKAGRKNAKDSQRLLNSLSFIGVFRDFQTEVIPLVRKAGLYAEDTGDFGFLNAVTDSDWMRRQQPFEIEAIKRVLADRHIFLKYLAKGQNWSLVGQRCDVNRINQAIESRTAARRRKDWAEADRIRDELEQMGIIIKDNPDGTTWELKR
jgi:cysteinyl-tRNA synthetase